MIPFPPGFEIPKFDKYRGRGSLVDHIKEFNVMCMEVAYNNSYLMCLFPQSLAGTTMDWFSHLPCGIKTFQEITEKFIDHFSFNLDMDVSLEELYTLKQNQGETFTNFLQRWRQRARKTKWPLLDEQQVGIIIANLDPNLSFHLKMQCITSYGELVPRALIIERALISQGNT